MKAPNWKLLASLVLAGALVNALWARARHYPFSAAEELFFLMIFVLGGLIATSFFERVRSSGAPRLRVEPAGPGVARVYVNDVEVGALPEEQYKEIVAEARASKRLYVLQALNIIASVGRFAADVARNIPLVWFLGLVLAAVCAPEALTATFTSLAQSTPAQLTQAVRECLTFGSVFSFIVCVFAAALHDRWYGVFSPFDRQVAQRLRKLMEVPAEGDVHVRVSQAFSRAAQ